jgi:hypothetical protein
VPDELPYQQANQIRQLLNERANADAYGQSTRVEAVDKQLEQLGYKTEKQAEKAAEAAEVRAAAAVAEASEDENARTQAPQGRSTRQQQTTEGGKSTSAKAKE